MNLYRINRPYKCSDSLQSANPDLHAATAMDSIDSAGEKLLTSDFALQHLTALTRQIEPADFVLMMAATFGYDIPVHTYLNLRNRLLTGELENARHQLVSSGTYPAWYDNRERTVHIHIAAVEQVIAHPESSWELLSILLHEFGHHLDNVLRHDLAERNADGTSTVSSDAPDEEGARHAYRMALFDSLDSGEIEIARYLPAPGRTEFIRASYAQAMENIRRTQAGTSGFRSLWDTTTENFEAGQGSADKVTHHEIARVLAQIGFWPAEIDAAYFGNWLRDYSQLLDPKLVRPVGKPKNFPRVFSREALSRIVDILAVKEFPSLSEHRELRQTFNAAPALLGVYRPSEHIDNPRTEDAGFDPRTIDPDFEAPVLPNDPTLQVDPYTSMKRYIQRPIGFMQSELREAMHLGRSAEGMLKLGSALHVLEDFFAHSNFVELSLIKEGHKDVLPWTSPANCKHGLPLVTGRFGGADIIASLAAPLGETLLPTEDIAFKPTVQGERTPRDQMILVLLSEHENPTYLQSYEDYLKARDIWAGIPGSSYVEMYYWFIGSPARALSNAFNTAMQGLLQVVGNSIDDLQTAKDDPNSNGSTDPTHSQLAKDHAEHPLHQLAAALAIEATRQVAQGMLDYWNATGAQPEHLASAFFTHPYDSTWQEPIVRQWAEANQHLVRRSTLKSELDALQQELSESRRRALQRFSDDTRKVLDFIFNNSSNRNPLIDLIIDRLPFVSTVNNIKEFWNLKNTREKS